MLDAGGVNDGTSDFFGIGRPFEEKAGTPECSVILEGGNLIVKVL